jgi:hypothetical protein
MAATPDTHVFVCAARCSEIGEGQAASTMPRPLDFVEVTQTKGNAPRAFDLLTHNKHALTSYSDTLDSELSAD